MMMCLPPELWPLLIDARLGSLESLRVTCRALYFLLAPLRRAECYDKRVLWSSDNDKKNWIKCVLQPYDRDTTQIYWMKRWHRINVAPTEEIMTFRSQLLVQKSVVVFYVNDRVHSVLYDDETTPPAYLWSPLHRFQHGKDHPNFHITIILGQVLGMNVSWEEAVEAYITNEGDIVNAIMALTPVW